MAEREKQDKYMGKDEIIVFKDEQISDLGQLKVKNYISDDLSLQDCINFAKASRGIWKKQMAYYYCAMLEIETKFKVLNQVLSLQYDNNPIETIKTRIKSLESIGEKLLRKKLPLDILAVEDHIFDIAGVRVICSFPEDIYRLAEMLLKQDDVTLVDMKDYISNPKANGYRSLHLLVEIPIYLHDDKKMMKVEVQLRTIAMDFWASLEHKLRYKKNLPEDLTEELSNELLECSQDAAVLDVRMQKIRERIDSRR